MSHKGVDMTEYIPNTTMMSPSSVAYTIDADRPVLSHGRTMEAEAAIEPHKHPRGQLLWAVKGLLRVTSGDTIWVVPSSHAVWIPSNVYHQVSGETFAETRNLYFDPSFPARKQDQGVVMLAMTSLMKEIILRLTSETPPQGEQLKRLGLVAFDEVESLQPFDMRLACGSDPRLAKVISQIVRYPQKNETLDTLSRNAGASSRTIERLFKTQTGYTYRQWRSRFRMMSSLESLRRGESTTSVAHQAGYRSVSSFISEFKHAFGCTPQQYSTLS